VVVWSREWLGEVSKIKRQGVLRMVRDVYHVCGFVEAGAKGAIKRIVLNRAAPLATGFLSALRALLLPQHVSIILDKI